MNLQQTIRAIEKTAALQPNVGTIVRGDIYRLNSSPVVRYGVVAWLQGEHRTQLDGSLWRWDFTLFYADRLTEKKDNEVEVQSVGIETLENILRQLADLGILAGEHTFRTFNERFSDECAGVFCNVTLEVPKDNICAQAYEFIVNKASFDLSFDESFKVWKWETEERVIYFI